MRHTCGSGDDADGGGKEPANEGKAPNSSTSIAVWRRCARSNFSPVWLRPRRPSSTLSSVTCSIHPSPEDWNVRDSLVDYQELGQNKYLSTTCTGHHLAGCFYNHIINSSPGISLKLAVRFRFSGVRWLDFPCWVTLFSIPASTGTSGRRLDVWWIFASHGLRT